MSGIVVVSLFDGMACGYEALKRAGVHVREYHAFEIDRHAITIAKKNHPDIIHHGEINFMTNFRQFAGADLLMGGSPCQGFSFIGKQINFKDPRSMLFFEYVRAKREINPKKFLLENVKMKQQFLDVISSYLKVQPVFINSDVISPQSRPRNYWFNWKSKLPEPKSVSMQDVLLPSFRDDLLLTEKWVKRLNNSEDLKKKFSVLDSQKAICMTARQFANWKGNFITTPKGIRRLDPIECERLQTLQDNYSAGVSDSQRYKMIGNGWTVDVVKHLFQEMPIFEQNKLIERVAS